MRVIFYDFITESDAPEFLKTPALADNGTVNGLVVNFGTVRTFNAIGIGNTDAPTLLVDGQVVTLSQPDSNGLYLLTTPITASSVTLTVSLPYTVGRIAIGMARQFGISPAREPSFWSTANSRVTLSGQVIPGAGGVSGRKVSVDVRYKFDSDILTDIYRAFPLQLSRNFPVFFELGECSASEIYPWTLGYGYFSGKWVFQSSVNSFLYSKKLELTEAY